MNALLIALGLVAQVTYASASSTPATTTPPTIEQMIQASADKYGVDAKIMTKVIFCESSNRPDAIGDQGTSFGLSQIHLPAHPDITKEQAMDPQFAVDFMASEMAKGHAWKWTCWKKLSTAGMLDIQEIQE